MAKQEQEEKDFIKITTPKGVAKYAWLKNPSTKFDADGSYQLTLVLPADAKARLVLNSDDPVDVTLTEYLDGLADEAFKEGVSKCKTPKQKKEHIRTVPYEMELDADDRETGNILVRAKRAATKKGKDKDAPREPVTITFYDAGGTQIQEGAKKEVYSGSELKFSAMVNPFINVAGKSGVGLRLMAVQIIKLNTGSGQSAASHGFGEEEGYRTAPVSGEEEF